VNDTQFFGFTICYLHQTLRLYESYSKAGFDGVVEGVMMTIKIPLFKYYLID